MTIVCFHRGLAVTSGSAPVEGSTSVECAEVMDRLAPDHSTSGT